MKKGDVVCTVKCDGIRVKYAEYGEIGVVTRAAEYNFVEVQVRDRGLPFPYYPEELYKIGEL